MKVQGGNCRVSEKLYHRLREIDDAANSRLEQMIPGLIRSAGVVEALKATNSMKWAMSLS